jgi:hypothetical protein
MWEIEEGARSLTILRDILSYSIASDFIEKVTA